MNFMDAVEALKEGKKVKREHWIGHASGEGCIKLDSNIEFRPLIIDIEATDWKIVEEKKKPLSDWRLSHPLMVQPVYSEADVKEAIKEFLGRFSATVREIPPPYDLVKEVFGERLV